MEGLDHLVAIDLHGGAGGDGGGGGHAQAAGAGDGFFADELAGDEQGDGGFFAGLGDDGELGAACDEIEDAVGLGALGEEDAGRLEVDELTAWAFSIQEVSVGELRITFALHRVSFRSWHCGGPSAPLACQHVPGDRGPNTTKKCDS